MRVGKCGKRCDVGARCESCEHLLLSLRGVDLQSLGLLAKNKNLVAILTDGKASRRSYQVRDLRQELAQEACCVQAYQATQVVCM